MSGVVHYRKGWMHPDTACGRNARNVDSVVMLENWDNLPVWSKQCQKCAAVVEVTRSKSEEGR